MSDFSCSAPGWEESSSCVTLSFLFHMVPCLHQTHRLFSPAGPMAALVTPHCPSLCVPLLILAKESSNPFSLPFSRVQYFIYQRVFREATKHENILCTIFFFLRKSSFSQAWVTCHAVRSARAPLRSSHYLVCKESLCVHFDPKGDVGLVRFMLSLEPAF